MPLNPPASTTTTLTILPVLEALSSPAPRQQPRSRQPPSRTTVVDPFTQSNGLQPARSSTHAWATNVLQQSEPKPVDPAVRAGTMRDIDNSATLRNMEMQQTRRWRFGDVYAPHDLSGVEAAKWKKTRRRPTHDVFDFLGIDPLKEYKNFALMSEYMTEMGRIKHSKETGLRPVNQRKLAKAIRRSIGIGLMPSVHKHPEILARAAQPRQGK
ncbi:hypothetical protein H2201_005021 [Coniosporium apollinis]|uniref:Small ribosomal subunit protein bS18m n=2 Tax=Coniosporium TaxID=2810619 RepID=A0ABQ9NQX4_9PEZI|nr:hypothetical protein H2199_000676 [Cladosporium sp. JES 115]KAJ9664800.1 hypothetical protein H2201_005021 [Coniosporium apollinis]